MEALDPAAQAENPEAIENEVMPPVSKKRRAIVDDDEYER
jgi:hypothetical protein